MIGGSGRCRGLLVLSGVIDVVRPCRFALGVPAGSLLALAACPLARVLLWSSSPTTASKPGSKAFVKSKRWDACYDQPHGAEVASCHQRPGRRLGGRNGVAGRPTSGRADCLSHPPREPQGPPTRPACPARCCVGINFREASAQLRRQANTGARRLKSQEKYEAERLGRIRDELAKGISPEYLALLSSLYLSMVNQGQPKPVDTIADQLGKGMQTIQGHRWQARKRGFIEGPQGRKGGTLSPMASAILIRIVPSDLESLQATLHKVRGQQG